MTKQGKWRGRDAPSPVAIAKFLKHLAITCDVRMAAVRANRTEAHFHAVRDDDPKFRANWDRAITHAYPLVEAAMIADALQPATGDKSALHLRECGQKQRAMQILVKRHWQVQQGSGGLKTPARKSDTESDEDIRVQLLATFTRMRERILIGAPAGS